MITGKKKEAGTDLVQQMASIHALTTEGMRIVDSLRSNNYGISREVKNNMREICLEIIKAHINAWKKQERNPFIPMSLAEAMRTLKTFGDADNAAIVEYARLHQDHMNDVVDMLEKVRIAVMTNEELEEYENSMRQRNAFEGKRLKS